jgi:hypothetical protein
MYLLYKKCTHGQNTEYIHIRKCSLFGCNQGYIPSLLRGRLLLQDSEPFKWHLPIAAAMDSAGHAGETLVIDLKPKQHKTNLSLYEVCDVWGYSHCGWTPILLRLHGLFVDADPSQVDKDHFTITDSDRMEPIYEVMYVTGTVRSGRIDGTWRAPPVSPTNGALLWPDTVAYFFQCIQVATPNVLQGIQTRSLDGKAATLTTGIKSTMAI